MGFSRQEYWSGLPFPSPVDHILSDLSIMTHPSWVTPRAWLSLIELDKAVVLVWLDWLVSVSMVSVCLPSDAILQHLPSYLGFSYFGCRVSLHGCSSKVQPLFLTLNEGYLLTAALPDLQRGMAPLGPPAPMQPPLLGLCCLDFLKLTSTSPTFPPPTLVIIKYKGTKSLQQQPVDQTRNHTMPGLK